MAKNKFPVTQEMTRLILDATYELDHLARALPGLVPLDDSGAHYAVRGVAGRALRLTSVIMSVLDGDDKDSKDWERLHHMIELEGCGQG